jgi:PAT family beta-lactamase induction signal transducer AmpG
MALLVFVSLRLDEPPDEEDLEAPADRVGSESAAAAARLALGFLGRLAAFLKELYNGFFRFGWAPLVGVLLALAPKGAVALGLTVGVTMRVDVGLTDNQIATLSLVSSLVGALGCVAGGWISDRVGHRRSLVAWFALTTLPNLYLVSKLGDDGVVGLTLTAFSIATIAAQLANGLQYGTSNAVFMSVTNKKVAATQFTGYMALSNLANTYSAYWQRRYAQSSGYRRTLGLDALIAIVPILLVCLIRPRTEREDGGAGAAQ